MLKLERKSRDGQISVLVRDKEYLFNRTLWIALLLAMAFHSAFFILFRITPFKIQIFDTLIPPVTVESNTTTEGTMVSLEDTKPLTFHGIPFPPHSSPSLSGKPIFTYVNSNKDLREWNSKTPFFNELEEELYIPKITIPARKPKNPVEIIVSGPAAEMTFIKPTLNKELLGGLSQPALKPSRILYEVIIDGQSGKIHWFDAKEPTNIAVIDEMAENIIRTLAFTPRSKAFEVHGDIEIQFYPDAS